MNCFTQLAGSNRGTLRTAARTCKAILYAPWRLELKKQAGFETSKKVGLEACHMGANLLAYYLRGDKPF